VFPSPKFQFHEVGEPDEASVNCTVSGAVPEVMEAENAATGRATVVAATAVVWVVTGVVVATVAGTVVTVVETRVVVVAAGTVVVTVVLSSAAAGMTIPAVNMRRRHQVQRSTRGTST
jgi:hypothetical protein